TGDYAKQAYLDALLDEHGITADTLHMITRDGTSELTSDYAKAEFLSHVSRMSHDASTSAAIAAAAGTVSSDYYKTQLFTAALAGGGANDAVSRQVIASAGSVGSDYYRVVLLLDVLSRTHLSDGSLMSVIGSADGITSDYYRGQVLDSVAVHQSLGSRSVYTALLRGADGIGASYTRAEVLRTILARRDLTPDLAAATILDAAKLGSDNDKANVLGDVAETPLMKNLVVRDAFFATAKSISSGSEYRRAVAPVLP
ncbi:MAG TPA: hypothetical protein VII66_10190, partial [Gemmatimonadaceae bacterium]